MGHTLKYFFIGIFLGGIAFFFALPFLMYQESPLDFYPQIINSQLRTQQDLRQLARYFDENDNQIPILTYRQFVEVDETGEPVAEGVSLDNFEEQMKTLAGMECHFLTTAELLDAINNGTPLPKRSVMITFDDCSADIYEKAFPILKKYEIHATVNLIGYYIEHRDIYEQPLLSWDNVREMNDSGLIDFQSETYYTHSTLMVFDGVIIHLFAEHKDNENTTQHLQRISKDLIRNDVAMLIKLQKTPTALAYPYGLSNDVTTQAMQKANLQMGFDSNSNYRLNLSGTVDPYHIPRYEMNQTFPRMKDFVLYINTDYN